MPVPPVVVRDRLGFAEGPVVTSSGDLIVVSVDQGFVCRIGADGSEAVVHVGGGPNGATEDGDGTIYIANNGSGITPADSSRCTRRTRRGGHAVGRRPSVRRRDDQSERSVLRPGRPALRHRSDATARQPRQPHLATRPGDRCLRTGRHARLVCERDRLRRGGRLAVRRRHRWGPDRADAISVRASARPKTSSRSSMGDRMASRSTSTVTSSSAR